MNSAILLLILAVIAPFKAQCGQKKNKNTGQRNPEAARRMTEQTNRGEWRAAARFFAENTQNHGGKFGVSNLYTGARLAPREMFAQ